MIKTLKNYWKYSIKNRLRDLKYKLLYGVNIGYDHTMAACFGKGRFVSVKKNGPYIEITAHERMNNIPTGMIRLIPVYYNHGVMVEYHNDEGKIMWRTHCDYDMFYKIGMEIMRQWHKYTMPFVNRDQQKACYAQKARNPNSTWDCDAWSAITPKHIPKHGKKFKEWLEERVLVDFNNK